jgi:hypothetical protein
MKKIVFLTFLTITLVAVAILNQSCVPVLIGSVAYSHTRSKDAYATYVNETRKDNTEREVHGLKPNPILSYNDWKKGKGEPLTATNQPPTQTISTEKAREP